MKDCTDHIVRYRHAPYEQRSTNHLHHGCDQAGANNPIHVIDSSVSPHPAVQLKAGEDDEGEDCIKRREFSPVSYQIVDRDAKLTIYIETD